MIIALVICGPEAWLCYTKRSFVDETSSGPHSPEMVETGICGKVMRVAPFRVCHFLLEKGGIMVWSPDIYSCGNTIYIFLCGVVGIERSDKGPKGPGDDIFV